MSYTQQYAQHCAQTLTHTPFIMCTCSARTGWGYDEKLSYATFTLQVSHTHTQVPAGRENVLEVQRTNL